MLPVSLAVFAVAIFAALDIIAPANVNILIGFMVFAGLLFDYFGNGYLIV